MPKYRHTETMADMTARFWSLVQRCRHGEPCKHCCWPWVGRRDIDGYGSFAFRLHQYPSTISVLAHRLALELAQGAGCLMLQPHARVMRPYASTPFVVMHHCDTPCCCNPAHLSLGTIGDNVRDARRKRYA